VLTLGRVTTGVGLTAVPPGGTTQIVPARSMISIRLSGVKTMLVGSLRPMITVSLTKFGGWLRTFTVTGADVVRFPEVSRATAVS
jgi:hypothetical protein